MRIVVDAMGGDHGCGVIVSGVYEALAEQPRISLATIVGPEDEIKPSLTSQVDKRVQILHTDEVLTMEDKPIDGIRRKKNCSIAKGIDLLREKQADVFVSPGNTGGVVTVATIKLGRLSGVDRPGIATVIPTPHKEFVLLDSGANIDCKPIHLAHYAIMGSAFAEEILGHDKPRVGILSVGTEDTKGNELTLESFRLCKELNVNFVGNVEGHDLFNDRVDVVICDGFVGNIVLKTCESLAKGLFGWLKRELTANPVRHLAALLASGGLRKIKNRMDPDAYGGAPLLGLNGDVIIAHGSARSRSIRNAIKMTTETFVQKINQRIVDEVAVANDMFKQTNSMAIETE
ncbi:MAG: Phosphate acyltransferase [Verrucomicrobia subdivision 3 bacterium]|nr:Phosphate acyltransferase [Limisphaerales bacterium]MCS1415488.1 Phosphate acyltransferase [Limisphaerales bacterium]